MSISRRQFIGRGAALVGGSALRPAVARAAAPSTELQSAIDAAAAASLRAGACPGIAVEITRRGRPLLARHYGLANLETGTAVTGGSVFRVGSLTKQFTAALVLRLLADGRLALDDAASTHLPFFAGQPPFTLRELLHHTAGLRSDEHDTSCPAGPAGPKTQVDLAREIAAQTPLFDFPPGTAWHYSNANYIVLGAVVEAVTNGPLAAAASALLFAPLGLERTAFDTSAAVVRGRADGYVPVDGHAGSFAHAPFLEISDAGGAGAMRSTVADLCRWHHALFTHRLLDAPSVALMTTPGRLRDGRPSGARRFSPEDASYGDTQYGMGLLVPPASDGPRSVLHYGAIDGFAGYLETFVDAGVTVAVLGNGTMSPAMPFRAVRRAVTARLVPTPR